MGTPVKVTSPSLPDFAVETKVDVVSAVVDPERHTVPVRVRLDNADGLLKPNIYAQMRFATKAIDGAVEIAATALVSDGSHQYVYVQEEQGAIRAARDRRRPGARRQGAGGAGLATGEIVVEEGALCSTTRSRSAH